jgi:SAM-dependent methyltransferase
MKNIVAFYNKMSNFGKILVLITIFLIVIVLFKSLCPTKEGMISTTEKISYKEGESVYDDFYTNIYDYLVYNNIKNDYEIGKIVNSTNPTEASIIVDIGCGTGHQVSSLSAKNLQVMGIDISPSMIQKAKENYPTGNYKIGDAQDSSLLSPMSATHILCLYFTLYYFKDKRQFFDNCMDWLMPGGYLVVHMVNREHFDPILPSGNPLYVVSPQKYAKERITKTKVVFNDFVYSANFDLNKDTDVALFDEKFKFNDGNVRKQQQKMYMEDTSVIVASAQDCGFILQGKIDLVKCAYEHQYLYVFVKPS